MPAKSRLQELKEEADITGKILKELGLGDPVALSRAVEQAFFRQEIAAIEHIAPFAEELKVNPVRALQRLSSVREASLESAYGKDRAFIFAIAGGPGEDVSWPLYNAIGAVYPQLSREVKDQALSGILSIFDGLNYAIVNGMRGVGHTTGIREPLLLADIAIARRLYWPGLNDDGCEGPYRVRDYSSFGQLENDLIDSKGMFFPDKVNSDFLMAYYLLRRDMSHFADEYASAANQTFLRRVMQGIVWLRFGCFCNDALESVENGKDRLMNILPASLHELIEPLRLEGGWVDKSKFA